MRRTSDRRGLRNGTGTVTVHCNSPWDRDRFESCAAASASSWRQSTLGPRELAGDHVAVRARGSLRVGVSAGVACATLYYADPPSRWTTSRTAHPTGGGRQCASAAKRGGDPFRVGLHRRATTRRHRQAHDVLVLRSPTHWSSAARPGRTALCVARWLPRVFMRVEALGIPIERHVK